MTHNSNENIPLEVLLLNPNKELPLEVLLLNPNEEPHIEPESKVKLPVELLLEPKSEPEKNVREVEPHKEDSSETPANNSIKSENKPNEKTKLNICIIIDYIEEETEIMENTIFNKIKCKGNKCEIHWYSTTPKNIDDYMYIFYEKDLDHRRAYKLVPYEISKPNEIKCPPMGTMIREKKEILKICIDHLVPTVEIFKYPKYPNKQDKYGIYVNNYVFDLDKTSFDDEKLNINKIPKKIHKDDEKYLIENLYKYMYLKKHDDLYIICERENMFYSELEYKEDKKYLPNMECFETIKQIREIVQQIKEENEDQENEENQEIEYNGELLTIKPTKGNYTKIKQIIQLINNKRYFDINNMEQLKTFYKIIFS